MSTSALPSLPQFEEMWMRLMLTSALLARPALTADQAAFLPALREGLRQDGEVFACAVRAAQDLEALLATRGEEG